MEHLINIYNTKQEIVEKLLSLDNVKINLKVDGKPFQVFVENNEIYYHGRSGDETHIGPEIDDHTKLYSKPINYAISKVKENKNLYLNNYKFLTFEILGEKMLLTSVIDKENRFIESAQEIRDIADFLNTDVMPTLWEGKLTDSQIDSIINILESGIIPEKENFINWVKEQFGEYEHFPETLISAADDFIEGLVFFFPVGDKIAEYKLVDPTYRKLIENRKKEIEIEKEKNKEVYEAIYNIFINSAENLSWNNNINWELNIEENFLEMMKDLKIYNKLMNLGAKIRINESETYTIQENMVIPELRNNLIKNGSVYKNLFEMYEKTFYKEKKRGYIISKDFQNRVNKIISENRREC